MPEDAYPMPNMQQTLLQFISIVHLWLIDLLLDDAPYVQELNLATQFPVFIGKFAHQFLWFIAYYEIHIFNESFIFVTKHHFGITEIFTTHLYT